MNPDTNTKNNIRIVLIGTSHPGNIGAVARAMKNMNLQQLYLVQPKIFPHAEATARAAGADDILQNAIIVPNLKSALAECQLVIGTSARNRFLPIELLDPKEAAIKIISETSRGNKSAIVFGIENSGMSNEELQLCNCHVQIPTNSEFSSLNLAAAVLVIAYEINMALKNPTGQNFAQSEAQRYELATFEDMELFYKHLEEVLKNTKFLDERNPRLLMQRLRRIFSRIRLEKSEVNILRGILSSMQNNILRHDNKID